MLRFEYDRVVAYHPYRTSQPWDLGGTLLLQVDGVNGSQDEADVVRAHIGAVEMDLLRKCRESGIRAHEDNHYGFTVLVEGERGRPDPGAEVEQVTPDLYYQLRFSDGSLYVWLMPGPPEGLGQIAGDA